MPSTSPRTSQSRHPAIYQLNHLAFGQESESKLVDALRDSEGFIPDLSLVATVDDNIVGHILLRELPFTITERKWKVWLFRRCPFYLLFNGKGLAAG